MQVSGFYSPVIVDLAGLKASRGKIPILLDHDTSQIIGQTDADGIHIDASGVDLAGTITGEGDATPAGRVIAHAKNGFEWQASIGASIVRQEFLKAGEKAVVNGREITGPILIARESRLYETSFVAIGADHQTTAAVAAADSLGNPKGVEPMFEKWLQAKGIDPEAVDENTMKVLRATFDAEQEAARRKQAEGQPSGSLDEIVAARRKEDDRIGQITKLAAGAIDERPVMVDEFEKLARAAIEAKSTVPEFELELMRLMRHRPVDGTSQFRGDPRTGSRMIEAILCISGGLDGDDLKKVYGEQTVNAAMDRWPIGIGLKDLLLMAARERGFSGHASNDVRGMLEAAFGGSNIRANTGFSTMSLPGIMSNVANKFLVAGFNAVETGWRELSSVRPVRDFKTNTSYSLTGAMTYEKVGPAGELKHASVSELPYTIKADTYGKMFAITRQDIINDDLGALTVIPTKLGRGAALAINAVFWTEYLANAASFWTAGRGNLLTGAGSALSSAGLQAAQLKFAKMTDPDGMPLGIQPKILLVPPELEIPANELMTSLIVNTGGSSTTDKVPNKNVWANKYRVVVSSYLSNPAVPGSSPTAWYLIADPADLPVIEVAFLNGRQEPVVETADADFNVLGIQMRGYHDWGVAKQEYRAAVKSAGA